MIINADDLGISVKFNTLTFRLMDLGKVTSATLLVAGPDFEDAAIRAKCYPNCSFGVHLNLTEFRPLTESVLWDKFDLINKNGHFNNKIRNIKPSGELRYAVFEEWCAQIDRVIISGINISHLDSHHHVHTIPWLFTILKLVQKKYGIRKVRISNNLIDVRECSRPWRLIIAKWLWNCALKNYYKTKVTDYFTSFYTFNKMASFTARQFHGTIELMVHPGAVGFSQETLALSSNWVNFSSFPYRTISYNDI